MHAMIDAVPGLKKSLCVCVCWGGGGARDYTPKNISDPKWGGGGVEHPPPLNPLVHIEQDF